MKHELEIAPKDQVYVCSACGKTSKTKQPTEHSMKGWDASCMLSAVLCKEDSLKCNKQGIVKSADAV